MGEEESLKGGFHETGSLIREGNVNWVGLASLGGCH
jgi:hypothetical protein